MSDLRATDMPSVVWPPVPVAQPQPKVTRLPAQRPVGQTQRVVKLDDVGPARPQPGFYLGQISAVLSLARTNKLNYRAAVKQIETIVHNYESNHE